MIGVMRSATMALTTAVKAAPMTTATARSTRLPRKMNCRNSLSTGPIVTLGQDGPFAVLRRDRGLGAERAARAARDAAAPRRRRRAVRLRGGHAAPAGAQRRPGRPQPRVPHALPRRSLARAARHAQVLRAARPRPAAHGARAARDAQAARGVALRLRPAEVPVRDPRARAQRG